MIRAAAGDLIDVRQAPQPQGHALHAPAKTGVFARIVGDAPDPLGCGGRGSGP